jgi:hypothetical protein
VSGGGGMKGEKEQLCSIYEIKPSVTSLLKTTVA